MRGTFCGIGMLHFGCKSFNMHTEEQHDTEKVLYFS